MNLSKVISEYMASTLIEHTSEDIVGYPLVRLLNEIMENHDNSLSVVITDFVDTLPIYLYQAKLLKLDTSLFKNISVIKVGGKINVGKVVYNIPISQYPVYKTRYEESLLRIAGEQPERFQINIQVGIERIMTLFPRKELIAQINDMGRYIIQNRNMVDIIFINTEAIEKASSEALPLLRVMFPLVLQLEDGGETFAIKKSVFRKLRGIRGDV